MTEQREWRIGELARATRVTVRALHHYDRLGLLVPSSRTAGGHRCYTGEDVRRLHTILALRGFGLQGRRDVPQGKAESPQRENRVQPAHVVAGVAPMPAGRPRRRHQQTQTVVMVQRAHGHPGRPGKFPDPPFPLLGHLFPPFAVCLER